MDFGFLNMQTDKYLDRNENPDTLYNAENFSVLRVRRQVINQFSDVGMILTNRMDLKGNYNTTYGLDATIRVFGETNLSLRWAQSFHNFGANEVISLDPTRFWISLGNISQRGLSYGASISRAGKYFDPGMGFEQRENYTRSGQRLSYKWYMPESSKIFRHGFDSGGSIHWTNIDGSLESLRYRIGWEISTKSGWIGALRYVPNFEQLIEEFELTDDVVIPIGDYWFNSINGQFHSPFSEPFNAGLEFEYGGYYDGNKTTLSISPTFNISPSFEVGGFYQFNDIRFDTRQDLLAHITRIKGLWMFNTKLSVSAFVQYNSLDHVFLGNIRLRYNPKEGNDFYIVYNDDMNSNRERESPFLPVSNERTFLFKFTYTFKG
jgi:hypothetical protein